MPKGDQQDVPGPFSGMRMHVRRTVKTGQLTTPQPVLRFHDDMDQDGRDELVALLNKGTHYDSLWNTLRLVLKGIEQGRIPDQTLLDTSSSGASMDFEPLSKRLQDVLLAATNRRPETPE